MAKPKLIFRTVRTSGFTTIPNTTLREARLSYKARGMLALILTNKDEWNVTSGWLEDQGTEGREAIRSGLDELKALGFARYEPSKGSNGRWQSGTWTFYDSPTAGVPDDGNPSDGSTARGKPAPSEEQGSEDHLPKAPAEPVAVVSSPHQEFIGLFTDAFLLHFGFKYAFKSGIDGRGAKEILANTKEDPKELVRLAMLAWSNKADKRRFFHCEAAVTICGFSSRFNEIREQLRAGGKLLTPPPLPANFKGGVHEFA